MALEFFAKITAFPHKAMPLEMNAFSHLYEEGAEILSREVSGP